MQLPRAFATAPFALLLCASPLAAQPDAKPAGDQVELGEDPLVEGEAESTFDDGDSAGAAENPDAPKDIGSVDTAPKAEAKASALTKATYPQELAHRPITLVRNMALVRLDVPVNVDPFSAGPVLTAGYGITDKAELTLRYNGGALTEDDYITGKAVGLDFVYELTSWIAVQAGIPMYMDPFAMGLTLGAPMKFRLGDKVALEGGRDFFKVKLAKFVPELESAAANEALVALENVGTTLPAGSLRFVGDVTYQKSAKLALLASFGLIANDFGTTDAVWPLDLGVSFSPSRKLDLGGHLGMADLTDNVDTLYVSLFVGYRL